MIYVHDDVKVRKHCHITGKFRKSAHRYCNIKVKLNHKLPLVFRNLKNCNSYLMMSELVVIIYNL